MSFHGAAKGLAVVLASMVPCTAAAAQSAQRTHGLDAEPPATVGASVAQAGGDGNGWCPNPAPGANQVDNGQYRYHAVYAHASDRPSNLDEFGGLLQRYTFTASAVLERQYRRAIRFDIGTPCGRGQLDISTLRLPLTTAELNAAAEARGTATFDAVAQSLRLAGYGVAGNSEPFELRASRTENFLVFLDAPHPARTCGQGTALLDSTRSETNANNMGGKLAVIFRDGSDFCGPDVVRHEIGHNLGALQPDAPNTTDGVHCNDAFEDTMCSWESPKISGGAFNSMWFDYGNDDYWDPPNGQPLGWWTLNLSRFLCTDPGCNRPDGSGVANRTSENRESSTAKRHRRPRLARRVKRGARYTRVRLRARGSGRARLVVRCRHRLHPRRTHPRRVMNRRISLPRTVRIRTRCRAPRARLTQWRPPVAARK